MSLLKKLSVWAMVALAACVLALCWASAALAQVGDGDGFDGDELLTLPVLLLWVGVLAIAAWSVYQRMSSRSQK